MEEIRVIGGENYPDTSKYPKEDDLWNANISNIVNLEHVVVASCISSALNILRRYPVIIVYPETTRQNIMDDWGKIKEYRTDLNSIQGVFSGAETAFNQTVYRLHNEFKMSYKEIARFLNFEIVVFLCAGLGLVEELGRTSNEFPIQIFERFLVSYGYTIDEVQSFKDDARDALIKGKLPWNLNILPYSGPKIREMVRAFEKLVNDDNFIIDRKANYLPLFIINMNSRKLVENYFRKQYEVGNSEEKSFTNWHQLIKSIFRDLWKHQEEYYPKLPMG